MGVIITLHTIEWILVGNWMVCAALYPNNSCCYTNRLLFKTSGRNGSFSVSKSPYLQASQLLVLLLYIDLD